MGTLKEAVNPAQVPGKWMQYLGPDCLLGTLGSTSSHLCDWPVSKQWANPGLDKRMGFRDVNVTVSLLTGDK